MPQELISVIIPVYNVKPYLEKSLTSILAQTYQNIEVLAVDDGSTDGSLEILQAFAAKDGRLHYMTKENGGVSSARNMALEHATGQYISFMDPDDWVAPEFLQTLYTSLTEHQADLSICNNRYIYADGTFGKRTPQILEEAVVDTKQAYADLLLEKKFRSHSCNKLFKASLFSGLRFPEMTIHEDTFLMPALFQRAKRIAYTPFFGYFYLQRRAGSLLNASFNENRLRLFEAIDHTGQFVREYGLEVEFQAFALNNTVGLCNCLVNGYALLSHSQRRDYCRRVRQEMRRYGSPHGNPYVSFVTRFRLFLIRRCFPLYVLAYKLIKKLGI